MNGIEPDDGVDRVQVALSPTLKLGQELISHSIQSAVGEVGVVVVLQVLGDALVTVSVSLEGEDLGLKIVGEVSLVFLDELGLKSAGAVAGCLQLEATRRAFDSLGCVAVLAVGRALLGQMSLLLMYEHYPGNTE